jgi:transcriptional regulator with XRE-family HTH domain
MSNELGLALRLARVAVGKSQWAVARKTGIHPVVVNYLEHGKRKVDANTARALLREIKDGAPKSHLVDVVLDAATQAVNDVAD